MVDTLCRRLLAATAVGFLVATSSVAGAKGEGSKSFTFDPLDGNGLPNNLINTYAPRNTPGFLFSCFQGYGDPSGANCNFSNSVAVTCGSRFCRYYTGTPSYIGGFVTECAPSDCTLSHNAVTVVCY
jgi:hypothetical protein